MPTRRSTPLDLRQAITRRTFLQGTALSAGAILVGPGPGEAARGGSLLWYSGSSARSAKAWTQAFQKKTGTKVEFFRAGGVKLAQKFDAERRAGQVRCDIIEHAIPGLMSEWARKGYLLAYESPEAKHYPSEFRLPSYWTPVKALVLVIAYNADVIKPAEAPKRWEDLLDPKWKGKMVIPDVQYSGAALHWYGAIRSAFGKGYLERLAKQDVLVKRGSGATAATMTSGERPLAAMLLMYRVFADIRKKANLQVVIPDEGVPVTFEVMAIPAAAPNKEGAKRFLDYALSREAQNLWQKKFDTPSVRDDVDPLTKVRGRRPLGEIKKIASTAGDIEKIASQQKMLLGEWKRLFK